MSSSATLRSVLVWLALAACVPAWGQGGSSALQPDPDHPRYWQLDGEPLLLLGGFRDDNPFQIVDVEPLLDELVAAGGNYMRNTMSDRRDAGHEVYPFARREDGRYDLEQWNPEYWSRFERFLRLTAERRIVVQIELWDRFDYSRDNWLGHPYNPANNVNYGVDESGLETTYPRHPNDDVQPFFHSVPGMTRYQPRYDALRRFQEAYVSRLLSYSLRHQHVLYCMNNETSTEPRWGQFWMRLIRDAAQARGARVFATDMFDDGFRPEQSEHYAMAIAHPEEYPFLDISQINSRNFDQAHWDRLRWYFERTARPPRPLNHTKIYGSGYKFHGTGGPDDGVERFWRNLIAGSASARFHRPDSGNGLGAFARGSLRAARLVEEDVAFWDLQPRMELLSEREPDEAYLAADPGRSYLLYFTKGGEVGLDLTPHPGTFQLRWIDVHRGERWRDSSTDGGRVVPLRAPAVGPWLALILRPPS